MKENNKVNNDSIINIGNKNNNVYKMKTLDWNTLRIYTTFYHTYQLLYCKGHTQITSSHSIINIERKKRVNKKIR